MDIVGALAEMSTDQGGMGLQQSPKHVGQHHNCDGKDDCKHRVPYQFSTPRPTAILWAHRHSLPVRLSLGGGSFQFGRTSMWRPRAPHLAHTTLLANDGTSVSAG